MASQKEYSMLFALNANLNSGFQQAFGKASTSVAEMQKKVQALAKEQADITAYEKQQKAVDMTKNKLDMLKQQYDNIQREIEETGTYSSALENKLLAKQQQIDKTSASLQNQTDKLDKMGNSLQESGVNTDHLTEESKRLEGEMKALQTEQEKAAEEAQKYGDTASQAFEAAAGALVAVGLIKALKTMAAAYGECINASKDFEAAISQLAATMGVTKDDVNELREFALKMGAETKFSAVEAADGLNILAMSGLNATEQMAALPAVLNLASAGNMDLSTAASLSTASVKGFSDVMSNATYYTDLMAKGATMANTDVQGLGTALSSSAATAASYNQHADSLTVALLRLAEQNIVGEEASTKLNRAMADLYTPTDNAKTALEALGVSAYTSTGEAKDFNSVVDELAASLKGMSDEEANTYKNAIFTVNGLNAFNKMTVASTDTVNKFWKGVGEAGGSAAQQAATQIDNLQGAMTIMNSAAEGLKITLGDQFKGELTELVNISTEALSNMNQFVKDNPGLVKGVITFTGAVGGATAAITAASAAVKIFKTLSAMMIPGVGPILAATTAVAGLTAGVVALNAASDTPSLKDLTKQARELSESVNDANGTFAETSAAIEANCSVADMYVDRLEELRNKGIDSDEAYKEYHNTLELLVGAMPALADSIDLSTEKWIADEEAIRKDIEAYKEKSQAEAQQEYINAIRQEYNDVLIEQYTNEVKLTEATMKREAADKKVEEGMAKLAAVHEQIKKAEADHYAQTGEVIDGTSLYQAEIEAATAELEKLDQAQFEAVQQEKTVKEAIDADKEAVTAAYDAMSNAEEAVKRMSPAVEESTEKVVDHTAAIDDMNASLDNAYKWLEDISKAYGEAYEEAQKSIGGQYELWDDVEKVVATSADTINKKMESQTKYWSDYNANLEALRERAGDIDGLAEVIGSFADGSKDSVNAVAGMAKASDEDLQLMVKNFKELTEAQNGTAGSIAEMKTGFDEGLKAIVDSANENIRKLEQSDEAKKAAEDTMNAYLEAVEIKIPQVGIAYGKLQRAVRQGLAGQGYSEAPYDPSRGYATGTDNAAPGLALVGENGPELLMFGGGEKVINNRNTEKLISLGSTGNNVEVNFNIAGGASKEVVDQLNSFADDFADRVLAVINEAGEDSRRRAYA